MKTRVYGIVGATASGKTAASIALARAIGGEIVCMDSMQVYTGMDIGTAKPTPAEQNGVPHHMLNVVSPKTAFSVTEYAALARACLSDIAARGKKPVLVGGTGLYLRALSLPLDFGYTGSDEAIRRKYQAFADERGVDALHRLLAARDPVTAARLHPNDTRRVIRALEVYDLTGKPFSSQEMPGESDSPYDFSLFALDLPRERLYERIERRVDQMIADGLPAEVEALLASGVPETAQAMQGLGYKELIPVLRGEETLQSAVDTLKTRTRHYAKRQLTWFRADKRIKWIDGENAAEAIVAGVKEG